ncbi:MAG: hypothetical protein AAFX53_10330 [Bacteroidota bacterium]
MIYQRFVLKQFVRITLLVSIWINISEVFRYFVLVRPRVKAFFDNKEGVAEMDWVIFTIWGFWDMLLTGILVLIFWLYTKSSENNNKSILVSATLVWFSVFVIFWVATANMGLSDWSILWITLPLGWLEMVVGAWMASKLYTADLGRL